MHKIRRLGYFSLGVADLDEAIDYYARFVRLDLTERIDRTAFMTGGLEHHWLRLEEGSGQGLKRIGYEVESEAALAEIRGQLGAWGIEYTEGGDFRTERVQRWLRFTDPGGFELDLFTGMAQRPVAAVTCRTGTTPSASTGRSSASSRRIGWATPWPFFGAATATTTRPSSSAARRTSP